MGVTVGGQEFSSRVNVSVFPDSREDFEIEANKVFALDSETFSESKVSASGSTVWVSRESREGGFLAAIEVTVFAPDGVTVNDVIEHMRDGR